MSKKGPMLIVEDDHDDWEVMKMVLQDLNFPNELKHFDKCEKALDYLCTTSDQPFLIICDVNMPRVSGIEFRETINSNEYLRKKSIPFVFMSTSATQPIVDHAYNLDVQGFFEKGQSFDAIKSLLQQIIGYWKLCRHPNTFK